MKKVLDCVNLERRQFVKKMTMAPFVVPVVLSVTMVNQKLDLSTANAASENQQVTSLPTGSGPTPTPTST